MLRTSASTWRNGSSRRVDGARFMPANCAEVFDNVNSVIALDMVVLNEIARYDLPKPSKTECIPMLRLFSAVAAVLGSLIGPALAQDAQRSECLAMANAAPRAMPANFRHAAAGKDGVTI